MNLFVGSLRPKNTITTLLAAVVGIFSPFQSVAAPTPQCEFDTELGQWLCGGLAASTGGDAAALDWIPAEFFSPKERKQLTPGCTGIYLDPLAEQSTSAVDMSTLPLLVEADATEVRDGTKARLRGDVQVSQGTRSISADEMAYDRTTDEASLEGNVTIRQPDMLIRGEGASVSTIEQSGRFDNARFVMHSKHMRGRASSIEQDGPNRIVLRDGMITSCEPGSNAWSLEGEELSISRDTGQGYGKNVTLKLGSIPVFYIPYISFPVGDQRRSGLLFPSISTSGKGLDISMPYYLNLAPNYDATITPRLITGRGSMLETDFRHLSELFSTEISGAFLPNDGGGNDEDVDQLIEEGTVSESELRPHKGANRWLVKLNQTGGRRNGWYSEVDYTKISDEDYFRDLGSSSFSVANRTYLNQSVDVGTQLKHWTLAARVQDYQTLLLDLTSPYRKLPQLNADANYQLGNTNLRLKNELTHFDHRDEFEFRPDGSPIPIITGHRLAIDHRVSWDYRRSSGFFTPELGFKGLYYNLTPGGNDELSNDIIQLGAAQASIDTGLVFERSGDKYLQSLEPRAFYLFREYQNHDDLYSATDSGQTVNFDTSARTFSYNQLYRDSRFSGSDRLDDANQLTLGITNRWYSAKDGHELFNVSVGQINLFRDRRIGLEQEITNSVNASEFALEFGANWRNGSGLYGSLIYDEAADQMNRFSTGYNYASTDQQNLFSIGYNFVRANPEESASEQLDQMDMSFVASIKPQWAVMGRANYDFQNAQELETFLGFEYNNCCYRFRVLARRWLDSNIANISDNEDVRFDQGIFFEIHLKGLGGSGARVNTILEDAIPGYRRREEALNAH